MRIGVFYSGIYWQEHGIRKCGYSYDLIYIYRSNWSLFDYDILIVPKGIHQGFLKENSEKIYNFVDAGGLLISFGEVDGNWLNGCLWQPSQVGRDVTIVKNDHEIFKNLTDNDINPWSKAVHGYFDQVPDEAEKLMVVKGKENHIIAFLDEKTYHGSVLAMTLDPDYHTYSEIPFARILLNNIIEWAISKSAKYRTRFQDESRISGFVRFKDQIGQNIKPVILIILIIFGFIGGSLIRACTDLNILKKKNNVEQIDNKKIQPKSDNN